MLDLPDDLGQLRILERLVLITLLDIRIKTEQSSAARPGYGPHGHLLTVAGGKCDGASRRTRLPIEDRDEGGGRAVPVDPTGLDIRGCSVVEAHQPTIRREKVSTTKAT
ncbi:hypothetical protein OG429_01955 [Streptomyces sp. NBC_00190]|uniref:hypothetical protein n=1 Tax=unclassified Streptomyces TaxID=2593676 RepID=UPI002E2BF118|nr:hypothetical protein [Streptomyces sp. NBC_00190]WSZ45311.1 hypothetical protein OG239_04950 [Streptomyces sp. NBC_00868]